MRLIDGDALRDWWLHNGENENVYCTNDFLDSIDDAPTIEVIPDSRGQWIRHSWYDEVFKCSKCACIVKSGIIARLWSKDEFNSSFRINSPADGS